jgi:hypothetical protein
MISERLVNHGDISLCEISHSEQWFLERGLVIRIRQVDVDLAPNATRSTPDKRSV